MLIRRDGKIFIRVYARYYIDKKEVNKVTFDLCKDENIKTVEYSNDGWEV